MKQKQRKWKNLVALCSTLMLLLSCVWTTPVYAVDTLDYSLLMEQMADSSLDDVSEMADSSLDVSELVKNAAMDNAAGSGSEVPIFTLLMFVGDNAIANSAFYVQDGNGSAYLMTSGVAAAVAKQYEEAEFYLVADGYQQAVKRIDTRVDGAVSVLEADGLQNYTPFQITNGSENDDYVMFWSEMENNIPSIEGVELDMDAFLEDSGFYWSDYTAPYEMLGAPVLDQDTGCVWGMIIPYENEGANYLAIGVLNEILAGGAGGSSGGIGGIISELTSAPWMIGAVIGVVIGIVIRKKKKNSKKKPAQEAANNDGTVILQEDRRMDALNMHTGISAEEAAAMKDYDSLGDSGPLHPVSYDMTETQPVQAARYQLRGMSGTFKGQIFEVNGTMKIGRDPLCGISYPQETGGISGNHCLVMEEVEGILLRDLNSTYGTFYGGVKMHPQMDYHLTEGDTFYLADPKYTFRVERAGEYRQEFTPVVKAVTAPVAGKQYHANANKEIYFGRGNGTQVQFTENDTKISTKHCVLYRDNTGFYLMDLGSTNGTFMSETLRLKPNVPYRVEKGMAFFLAAPKYTFVVTED